MVMAKAEARRIEAPADGEAPARTAADRWRAAAPIGLTVVVGAFVAWWSAYHLLPHGSYNLDELVYLNQAEAIRHGRLTYDTASYVPDFRPYLSGVAGDRVVFKYQPLWPAVLALSEILTADHRPALVLAGAGVAVAFWMLGRELTGSRWLATALAVGLAVSPVFVAHSGTALAYLPAAALAAASLAAVMRAVRTGSRWCLVTGGLVLGALFFHRPFDAALVGIPIVVWLASRARQARDWRPLLVLLLAAVPFVLAWLAYNWATTGNPLQPAFSVGAPSDRFGFGRRASWEATGETFVDGALRYSPAGAWQTVRTFTAVTPLWIIGGVVSVALMAAALVLGRRDVRRWVLVSTIGLTVVGHFFWWGTQNFVNFGLHRALGPAYWLVGLGPAAGLATLGARDTVRALADHPRRRRLLAVGAASFVAMTVPGVMYFVDGLGATREARSAQLAAIDAAPDGTVVLFPTGVRDPFLRAMAPDDLEGSDRLHAVDLERADQRFRLYDRFPERALWAWVQDRPAGTMLDGPAAYELAELPQLRTPEAVIGVTVRSSPGRIAASWLRALDDDGHELARRPLDPVAAPGPARAVPGPGGRSDRDALAVGSDPGWLAVGTTIRDANGGSESVEVRWMVRARDGRLEVIGPGLGFRLYAFPDEDAWLQEDVGTRLRATFEGLPPFEPLRRIHRVS